jgi:hypothetical protein
MKKSMAQPAAQTATRARSIKIGGRGFTAATGAIESTALLPDVTMNIKPVKRFPAHTLRKKMERKAPLYRPVSFPFDSRLIQTPWAIQIGPAAHPTSADATTKRADEPGIVAATQTSKVVVAVRPELWASGRGFKTY